MPWRKNRLLTRLNIILGVFFVLIVLAGALLAYQRQRALILTFVKVTSRFLAGAAIDEMSRLQPPYLNVSPQHAPAYHSNIRLQGLAQRISMRDEYRLKVVSLAKSSRYFAPSAEESREMEVLRSRRISEYDWIVEYDGNRVLSYMRSLTINATCLGCHGTYEAAPEYIRRLFPRDSPVFNHSEGEIVGAISVTVPMRDIAEEVWINVWPDITSRFLLLVILTLALRAFIRKDVLDPLSRLMDQLAVDAEIGEIPSLGGLDEKDEISALIIAHNKLMEQMGQKVRLYRESEERYRNIVELARVPILTIAANGKIILSNKAAERVLGRKKEELLGEEFYSFLRDDRAARTWVTSCGEGGGTGASAEFCQEVRTAEGWKEKLIEIVVLDNSKSLFAVRLLRKKEAA